MTCSSIFCSLRIAWKKGKAVEDLASLKQLEDFSPAYSDEGAENDQH